MALPILTENFVQVVHLSIVWVKIERELIDMSCASSAQQRGVLRLLPHVDKLLPFATLGLFQESGECSVTRNLIIRQCQLLAMNDIVCPHALQRLMLDALGLSREVTCSRTRGTTLA